MLHKLSPINHQSSVSVAQPHYKQHLPSVLKRIIEEENPGARPQNRPKLVHLIDDGPVLFPLMRHAPHLAPGTLRIDPAHERGDTEECRHRPRFRKAPDAIQPAAEPLCSFGYCRGGIKYPAEKRDVILS